MNYLTKTINRRSKIDKKRTKSYTFELITFAVVAIFLAGIISIVSLNVELAEAKEMVRAQEAAIEVQQETIATLNSDLDNVTEQSEKIIAQNKDLKKKVELYDKYDYALIDSAGNRTDITTEQLEIGVKEMKKAGIDPNLLFSIIMIESRGQSDAANKSSTARGYCQLLDSTGLAMYKRLGYDGSTYNHSSMALNGDLNIKMGAAYLTYLMDYYNGDIIKTLNNYCGYLTDDYRSKLDGYLDEGGTSLAQIQADYISNNG